MFAELICTAIVLLALVTMALSVLCALLGGALAAHVEESPVDVLSALPWAFAHDEYADLPEGAIVWINESTIDCEATDNVCGTWGLTWV